MYQIQATFVHLPIPNFKLKREWLTFTRLWKDHLFPLDQPNIVLLLGIKGQKCQFCEGETVKEKYNSTKYSVNGDQAGLDPWFSCFSLQGTGIPGMSHHLNSFDTSISSHKFKCACKSQTHTILGKRLQRKTIWYIQFENADFLVKHQ